MHVVEGEIETWEKVKREEGDDADVDADADADGDVDVNADADRDVTSIVVTVCDRVCDRVMRLGVLTRVKSKIEQPSLQLIQTHVQFANRRGR